MATTAKRSKKKSVKKNSSVKRVSPKKVLNNLDDLDLRYIPEYHKDVVIAQKDMALEEQAQKNMHLELLIMQANIEKQRKIVTDRADKYEKRKEKYKAYLAEISPKYGLKEGESLAYNPDTGEIVRD